MSRIASRCGALIPIYAFLHMLSFWLQISHLSDIGQITLWQKALILGELNLKQILASLLLLSMQDLCKMGTDSPMEEEFGGHNMI
jgi:hypothetical protein